MEHGIQVQYLVKTERDQAQFSHNRSIPFIKNWSRIILVVIVWIKSSSGRFLFDQKKFLVSATERENDWSQFCWNHAELGIGMFATSEKIILYWQKIHVPLFMASSVSCVCVVISKKYINNCTHYVIGSDFLCVHRKNAWYSLIT